MRCSCASKEERVYVCVHLCVHMCLWMYLCLRIHNNSLILFSSQPPHLNPQPSTFNPKQQSDSLRYHLNLFWRQISVDSGWSPPPLPSPPFHTQIHAHFSDRILEVVCI